MPTSESSFLEAIAAEPDAPEPYLVYADWLQSRGDPRGELILLQHARDEAPDWRERQTFVSRERAYLSEHAAELLGDLEAFVATHTHYDANRCVELQWSRGFISSARVWWGESASSALPKVLANPSARFLRHLDVPFSGEELESLDAAPDTLSALSVGEVLAGTNVENSSGAVFETLAPLASCAPRLRRLCIRARSLRAWDVDLPALKRLNLQCLEIETFDDDVFASLADLPCLEELEIWRVRARDWTRVGRLDVRRLSLPYSLDTDALCVVLNDTLSPLEVLDLTGGTMTDDGAAALAPCAERIERLVVRDNFLYAGEEDLQTDANTLEWEPQVDTEVVGPRMPDRLALDEMLNQARTLRYQALHGTWGEEEGAGIDHDALGRAIELLEQVRSLARAGGRAQSERRATELLGECLRAAQRPDEAVDVLARALLLPQEEWQAARLLRELQSCLDNLGFYEDAAACAAEAEALSPSSDGAYQLTNAARSDLRVGRFEPAIEKATRAAQAALEADNKRARADALDTIAIGCQSIGRIEQAERASREAVELLREIGDRFELAKVLFNLGTVVWYRHAFDEVEEIYNEALQLSRETGRTRNEALVIMALGQLAYNRGRLREAQELLDNVVELHTATHNTVGLAGAHNLLACVQIDLLQFAEAKRNLLQARELFEQLGAGQSVALSAVLDNLALVALEEDDIDRARIVIEEALDLHRNVSDARGEAIALITVGDCALRTRDLDGAEAAYRDSLIIHEQRQDLAWQAVAHGRLGLLHMTRGTHGAARESWTTARDVAIEAGHETTTAVLTVYTAFATAALGDRDGALSLLSDAREIIDAQGDAHGEELWRVTHAFATADPLPQPSALKSWESRHLRQLAR